MSQWQELSTFIQYSKLMYIKWIRQFLQFFFFYQWTPLFEILITSQRMEQHFQILVDIITWKIIAFIFQPLSNGKISVLSMSGCLTKILPVVQHYNMYSYDHASDPCSVNLSFISVYARICVFNILEYQQSKKYSLSTHQMIK